MAPKKKAAKKVAKKKSTTRKRAGAPKAKKDADLSDLPQPDATAQLLLDDGKWLDKLPAAVKRKRDAWWKLKLQRKALNDRESLAKRELLETMERHDVKKVKSPDGKEWVKRTSQEKVQTEPVKKPKAAKKKGAA